MNTRETAAILVSQIVQKKRSLTALLSANKNDQSLIQELCYGTLRWYFKLNESYCYVQNATRQFAGYLLKLENDQTALDACEAPGSKTSHILKVIPHLKTLVAIDNNKQRLKSN